MISSGISLFATRRSAPFTINNLQIHLKKSLSQSSLAYISDIVKWVERQIYLGIFSINCPNLTNVKINTIKSLITKYDDQIDLAYRQINEAKITLEENYDLKALYEKLDSAFQTIDQTSDPMENVCDQLLVFAHQINDACGKIITARSTTIKACTSMKKACALIKKPLSESLLVWKYAENFVYTHASDIFFITHPKHLMLGLFIVDDNTAPATLKGLELDDRLLSIENLHSMIHEEMIKKFSISTKKWANHVIIDAIDHTYFP